MELRKDSHQLDSQAGCSSTCTLSLTSPSRKRFPLGYLRHNQQRRLESKRRSALPPRYTLAATLCESSFFSPFPPDVLGAATTTTSYTKSRKTSHQSILRSLFYSSHPYTHQTSTYTTGFRLHFSLSTCPLPHSPSPSLASSPRSYGTTFSARSSRTRSA